MTATPSETTPVQPYAVIAQPGTRLEQLQAEYATAKAARDAAEERYKAITDGIKAELQNAVPDRESIELRGADDVPTLELVYVKRATFDSARFKKDDPETYVRYAKFGGSWTLREQRGQR